MSLLVKSEIICNICKLILKDPVTLPCSSDICGEHLRDDTVKNGVITCEKCEKNFDVPRNGFATNLALTNLLANEFHLSNEEKTIKRAIQDLINQLKELQHLVVTSKRPEMELANFEHFTEIRRQIDIQREELKKKIDEIALKLIDQVNARENVYKSKLNETISGIVFDTDLAKYTQLVDQEFRRPKLLIEEAERLKIDHAHKVAEFEAKIKEFASLGNEIKSFKFEPRQELQEIGFGCLKLKDTLIACNIRNEIQIWNINSSECMATLLGHTANIERLEYIDENRFASGSYDTTIRIWDSKNAVCIKTLTQHNVVISLKSLSSNRIASGSDGDIIIWNIESGECLQTLNGHSGFIYDMVLLRNGNLVSCSWDKTIKVWDLVRDECIKTLTDNSSIVTCLVLLRNDQLACGLMNTTIKIWDLEGGECVKTLYGHSHRVQRLEQLESGELVSCSIDKTIKIWNLSEYTCIRTLVGHTDYVRSIRINNQNNTLVSGSYNGIIKVWDLKTGECVNTIEIISNNFPQFEDLILI